MECKELESVLFQLSSEVCLRFLSTTLIRWIIVVEDWRQKDQLESGTVIQGEIKALGKKKRKEKMRKS